MLAEAARRKPQVVVLNARLPKKQLSDISAVVPGARLVYWALTEDLPDIADYVRHRIPEARGSVLDDARLLDRIQPIYRRKILNQALWAINPVIEVVGGSRCSYRAPVARNPFYRRLQLPSVSMGCSFCAMPDLRSSHWNIENSVAFAVKQIESVCRQRPTPGVEKRINLCGFELWRRFEELVRALVQRGVCGVELNFMLRLDELLNARRVIERCLPLLAENGAALRINGLSVENFSPDENRRLHKGITAEQVHEATAFLIDTNARWPAQFRLPFGGLGMILFTPWTTPEDLRINLDNIERCRLIDRAFALSRRLMLFRDVPITLLAEQDGLLVKESESIFYNAGCNNDADRNEIPWRFAHSEVAILWRLARRLSSDRFNIPADDPEKLAADAFIKESPPGPFDPLPLFREAIETIKRHPTTSSALELLDLLRSARRK
ncbi:MAG TPA: hypothetical protein DCZ01_00530 [Elusimicrobia bacterium]|nr:MAG: hypothetical protein A2X37_05130 [Elusimicrobia bacterium GWA2_66_18]OGR76935.1 MAG: hypothetical protein A2X40_04075 [Elusimicrobia bacterium GWC2_65_9]HAZ07018.1 hypothetical protein [Elusimicrobiota bacterium]